MKSTLMAAALVAFVAAMLPVAAQSGDAAWFDMQGCAFCKNLVKDPELLKNMSWEHHDIANGALSITVVKPEFKKSYLEAQAAMMEVGKKLQSGELKPEQAPMCGHCQAYGKLMQMGVKMEYVQGAAADVVLMTSDKPEVVKEIKSFAQRNREELAKMEQAEKAGHAH
jgi:hypothetical protein